MSFRPVVLLSVFALGCSSMTEKPDLGVSHPDTDRLLGAAVLSLLELGYDLQGHGPDLQTAERFAGADAELSWSISVRRSDGGVAVDTPEVDAEGEVSKFVARQMHWVERGISRNLETRPAEQLTRLGQGYPLLDTVKVSRHEPAAGSCEELASIAGAAWSGNAAEGLVAAKRKLRAEALARDANYVVLETQDKTFRGWHVMEYALAGTAYRCAAPAAAPEPAGEAEPTEGSL